jgi:hypothetical protein
MGNILVTSLFWHFWVPRKFLSDQGCNWVTAPVGGVTGHQNLQTLHITHASTVRWHDGTLHEGSGGAPEEGHLKKLQILGQESALFAADAWSINPCDHRHDACHHGILEGAMSALWPALWRSSSYRMSKDWLHVGSCGTAARLSLLCSAETSRHKIVLNVTNCRQRGDGKRGNAAVKKKKGKAIPVPGHGGP